MAQAFALRQLGRRAAFDFHRVGITDKIDFGADFLELGIMAGNNLLC